MEVKLSGSGGEARLWPLKIILALDCLAVLLVPGLFFRDYFRWRSEDALRNALGAHCYWMLRKAGRSVAEATGQLSGMSVADKNELLFQNGNAYEFNETNNQLTFMGSGVRQIVAGTDPTGMRMIDLSPAGLSGQRRDCSSLTAKSACITATAAARTLRTVWV